METKAPASFRDLAERDPYPVYEELRGCPVQWDEGMQAWIVSSFEGCKHVLRNDEGIYRHPFMDMDAETFIAISGGPRDIKFLTGDEHHRMHHWYLRVFSPRLVEEWRPKLIREVVVQTFDRIAGAGRADLSAALSDRIPVRVLTGLMGSPLGR